jgi:25S rRNA (uracil2634-N3)-methyltransferase
VVQAHNFPKSSPQTSELRPIEEAARTTSNTTDMSKTKTKRARRELKREGERKIAAHHRKAAVKAAETKQVATKPSTKKKQKMNTAATKDATPATKPAHFQPSQRKHTIPFGEYDHILLVGEGDFSFTRSLAIEHGCANVTATSYDSLEDVQSKYPSFASISSELSSLTPPVPLFHSVDATKLSSYKHLRCKRDDDDDDEEGWDTVAFMFPHTGGLSTDVNRQVRANQALLVDFFKSCIDTKDAKRRLQILQSQKKDKENSSKKRKRNQDHDHVSEQQQEEQQQPQKQQQFKPFLRMGGRIIVTLFEGEPYTLWNIRDLARHVGLRVVESWKFDWEQYPGYHHVRTLGALEGGGGWKGEDRDARMYVFEKIPLVADSDEEKEMERQAKVARGGKLPSQKEAMQKAMREGEKEQEEEEDDDDGDDDDGQDEEDED